MTKVMLKPAAGKLVRDPVTRKHLAEEGELKPKNTYWRRRLRDGDVVEVSTPKTAKASKKDASK